MRHSVASVVLAAASVHGFNLAPASRTGALVSRLEPLRSPLLLPLPKAPAVATASRRSSAVVASGVAAAPAPRALPVLVRGALACLASVLAVLFTAGKAFAA